MDRITINISIAGRLYKLNILPEEEETLRKVGKQIEMMVKDFEANFDVKDKQEALAMCALKLGTNAEINRLKNEKNIQASNQRVQHLNLLLEGEQKEV